MKVAVAVRKRRYNMAIWRQRLISYHRLTFAREQYRVAKPLCTRSVPLRICAFYWPSSPRMAYHKAASAAPLSLKANNVTSRSAKLYRAAGVKINVALWAYRCKHRRQAALKQLHSSAKISGVKKAAATAALKQRHGVICAI